MHDSKYIADNEVYLRESHYLPTYTVPTSYTYVTGGFGKTFLAFIPV